MGEGAKKPLNILSNLNWVIVGSVRWRQWRKLLCITTREKVKMQKHIGYETLNMFTCEIEEFELYPKLQMGVKKFFKVCEKVSFSLSVQYIFCQTYDWKETNDWQVNDQILLLLVYCNWVIMNLKIWKLVHYLSFSPSTSRKQNKIYKAPVFRHLTVGRSGIFSLRERKHRKWVSHSMWPSDWG